MIGFASQDIVIDYNSLPPENYSNFDKMSGYVKGAIRVYEDKIYKSLTAINPMCLINWYNEDSSNIYGYDNTLEQKIDDPTSVYIVSGVTTVWVQSNSHYFMATYTGTIDLTAESITSPTHFTDLGESVSYRHEFFYPNGKEDTLYWGYEGYTNRAKMFNQIINNQAINDRKVIRNTISFTSSTKTISSTTPFNDFYAGDKILIEGSLNSGEYIIDTMSVNKLSFTVIEDLVDESAGNAVGIYTYTYVKFNAYGIDKIAVFNVLCDEVEIKANSSIFTIEMIDTSDIIDFETFCFVDPIQLTKFIQDIEKDFDVDFEITFKGKSQRIGELVIGSSFDMGKAEDSAKLDTSDYNNITEATNGDLYLPSGEQQIVTATRFTVVIDTPMVNYTFRKLNELTNKLCVINANGDDNLPYLITYGYFSTHSLSPLTNSEMSTYSFTFRSVL